MKFGVDIPFVHHLGFELMQFEGGHSEIQLRGQARAPELVRASPTAAPA